MNRLACGFEVKFAANSDDGTFEGYGAVFGNVDSHKDVIEPGAFTDTLAQAKATGAYPAMLLMHGGMGLSPTDDLPIGIWTGMQEDSKGLHVQGKLALKTQRGAEAYELMKMEPRPALNGLSIGYRATKATNHPAGQKADGRRRTLNAVHLGEVSLVTDPSNGLARVSGVKSAISSKKELEDFLRDEGRFSRKAAKLIASGHVDAAFNLRDEDDDSDEEEIKALHALAALFSSK